MQYKVKNDSCEMKFMRDGAPVKIRRGVEALVSGPEYQFLTQVYGACVKGKIEMICKVTPPVEFAVAEKPAVVEKKQRKGKKR